MYALKNRCYFNYLKNHEPVICVEFEAYSHDPRSRCVVLVTVVSYSQESIETGHKFTHNEQRRKDGSNVFPNSELSLLAICTLASDFAFALADTCSCQWCLSESYTHFPFSLGLAIHTRKLELVLADSEATRKLSLVDLFSSQSCTFAFSCSCHRTLVLMLALAEWFTLHQYRGLFTSTGRSLITLFHWSWSDSPKMCCNMRDLCAFPYHFCMPRWCFVWFCRVVWQPFSYAFIFL